ncbi:MAG: hypothetical protein WCG27_02155, partial [Pseudomonadota bacterium]
MKAFILIALIITTYTMTCTGHASDTKYPFSIFKPLKKLVTNPAPHTFMFFINGDAEHFVTTTNNVHRMTKLYRRESQDVERIQRLAEQCTSCNVVILLDQRGEDRWFSRAKPWASYVRVFIRGQKVTDYKVPELNMADPKTLANLLSFTQYYFSSSKDAHLIYVGHAFQPTYLPNNDQLIAPFDWSAKESAYGHQDFVHSLAMAQLKKPLD